MKKLSALIFALFILVGSSVWAFQPREWSGYSAVKTADSLIHTGAGYLYGIVCQTDATNSVTFAVHDSTDNSGSKLHPDVICTTSATNRMCVYGFDPPIPFNTGLYVDITSSDTTPDYVVYYRGQ